MSVCRRLQRDLGNDFLELPVLCAKILDIVAGRFPQRVANEQFHAGFEEVFGPAGVEVRGDAFTPTQVGYALLASQSLEDDADHLLGRTCGVRAGGSPARRVAKTRLILPIRDLADAFAIQGPQFEELG